MSFIWKTMIIVLLWMQFFGLISGKLRIEFLKYEMCANNTPMIAYATFTTLNDTHHIINANYSSTIPSGNNIKIKLNVALLVREKWIPVFAMDNNNGACDNLNKYARGAFHDIQRRVKMKPGHCPIEPGTYHLENFLLNLNAVNFDTFPKGKIRLIAKLIEKISEKMVFCYDMIIQTKG